MNYPDLSAAKMISLRTKYSALLKLCNISKVFLVNCVGTNNYYVAVGICKHMMSLWKGDPRFVTKCDKGGRGVNLAPKSCDVIYGGAIS